jgi:hypothetical protein
MKAKVWITLQVEVEVEGHNEMALRQAAVDAIPNLEPDQHYDAINRAMEIGRDYPQDVTEIVSIEEEDTTVTDEARRQRRNRR